MIFLLEPQLFELLPYPDLGIGTLSASCKQQDLEHSVINWQEILLRCLPQCFDQAKPIINDNVKNRTIANMIRNIGHFDDLSGTLNSLAKTANSIRELHENSSMPTLVANVQDAVIIMNLLSQLNKFEETSWLDPIAKSYQELIQKYDPRIIGISLFHLDPGRMYILQKIREITDAKIILGGSITPFLKNHELEQLLMNFGDYIIVGRGENLLPKLIRNILKEQQPDFPNVAFLHNENMVYEHQFIPGEDQTICPSFDNINLDNYFTPVRTLPLLASLGCYYGKCKFCSHHLLYGKYEKIATESLLQTLDYLSNKYDVNHFRFHDEAMAPTQCRAIASAIGPNSRYFFSTMARTEKMFADPALIREMAQAGFRAMIWGVESGSQAVIDQMDKTIKIEIIEQILKNFHDQGILNFCFFMFGHPGETDEDRTKTISFIKKNSDFIHSIGISRFAVQRGSPIDEEPEKWDVIISRAQKDFDLNVNFKYKDENTYEGLRIGVNRLLGEMFLGRIQLGKGLFNCLPPMHIGWHLAFVANSFDIIRDGQFSDQSYPLAWGRWSVQSGKLNLVVPELYLIHRIFDQLEIEKRRLKLSSEETIISILCSGRSTFENVLNTAHLRYGIPLGKAREIIEYLNRKGAVLWSDKPWKRETLERQKENTSKHEFEQMVAD